ncbi:carbohydrate-binding domain-containing protein [Erysipelothrix sp. HDW6A]|uniref:carbohydrate-binding domain-containing protein n=1 Tax=Erysipelothrix sp. HDW6A TaxID=2714928 RepID=UPI00140D11DE|nr:carbohydrate-binding domain-containing protein [Erysipelothrix sp. HDW6A]QIK56957.1 carbohydrate-binding domain-containing protein [Erysipelothrix sp. HDW6A]
MRKKNVGIMSVTVLVLLAAITIWMSVTKNESSEPLDEIAQTEEKPNEVSSSNINYEFDTKYEDETWDDSTAKHITLNGNSTSIEGQGISQVGNTLRIQKAGDYVFTGTSTNLQIHVNVQDTETVRIILNGVTMTHASSAIVYSENADNTVITLAKNTTNTLSDGDTYTGMNEKEEPSATIFSNDDLIFNGSGELVLKGNFKNGIQTDDDLVIMDGKYQIHAKNDGIKGKDSVAIKQGSFMITADGDGIQASNATDTSKGWLYIKDATVDINALGDGLQAETHLQIDAGNYKIVTLENTTDSSNKGLKASASLTVNGGYFELTTVDDSIHSNGNVTINNGTYLINTEDDGMHADNALVINGGTIHVQSSYEGLEGAQVTINDGIISIVAQDDGINSAGGNDVQEEQGRRMDHFASRGDYPIQINGGTITVNANGDGIDANGNLEINGGDITVFGPTQGGNGYLDYDGVASITSGTLFASGTSDMMQGMSEDSSQASFALVLDQRYSAQSLLEIKDDNGNLLFSKEVMKDFNAFIYSGSNLNVGDTVHVSVNGSEVSSITLNSVMTNVSQNGQNVPMNQGPQGDRNQGGQRPGEQKPRM